MRTTSVLRTTMSLFMAAALVVALTGAMVTGCGPVPDDSDRVVVAVTILPQAGFVEAVGGDRVDVVVMVPPGASPHTYEATPDQMVQLSRASMYAMVGSPVDFELAWMDRLIAANRDMLVVDCSTGVDLLHYDDEHEHHNDRDDDHDHDHDHDGHDDDHEHINDHDHDHDEDGDHHHHTGPDPHIWLSVQNAKVMVSHICDGLMQVDPSNADYYRANCLAYVEELDALDHELRAQLESLEHRRFVVFHPAFGYFARDYDLVQIAVEQGGNEPDAQYLVRLLHEAKEHNIRIIFASPQFSVRSAEVIASEIGGEVVLVDPLAKDYLSNMRQIAAAIGQVS